MALSPCTAAPWALLACLALGASQESPSGTTASEVSSARGDGVWGNPAAQDLRAAPLVRARPVAAAEEIHPGEPLLLGVRLEIAPDWHVYWENPGDSGMPPRVDWELPDGVEIEGPFWPYPRRYAAGPLVSLGYSRAVTLGFRLRLSPEAAAGLEGVRLTLAAKVSWLACHDEKGCVPGESQVRWSAALGRGAVDPAAELPPELVEWERGLPRGDHGWEFALEGDPAPARGELNLLLRAPKALAEGERPLDFFPREEGRFQLASPPRFEPIAVDGPGEVWRMRMRLERGVEAPERVSGVLLIGVAPGQPPTAVLDLDTHPPAGADGTPNGDRESPLPEKP